MSWTRARVCDKGFHWLEVTSLWVNMKDADKIGSKIWNKDKASSGVNNDSVGVRSVLAGSIRPRTRHGIGEGLQMFKVTANAIYRVSCHSRRLAKIEARD